MTHRITKVAGDVQLPVTLEDAKFAVKATGDTEDAILRQYLGDAVERAETITHRAITQRSYLVVADGFPKLYWRLPLGYVSSITSIQYIDTDGVTQTWGAGNYTLDNASDSAATVRPIPTESWPDYSTEYPASARVTMVAGWAVDDVPYSIKQAIYLLFGENFELRTPGDPEADAVKKQVDRLLGPWTLPIFA